ncbi:transporter substrate-binding domain-containing protein [Thalassotalea sp. G2M2-11]|uniref:substrate-binding periplasmic protein n=1 Tax=Thalassotalea sp. G2M2-11 TaxID=2787627 RepID=UPI0019D1AD91|nr:transporter substrate-binding domain-containing protein [Thalassotalea sp. G2M2-11]
MKRVYWLIIFSLVIHNAIAEQTITISTSEWPPYISEKSPNYGYICQIVEEAFGKMNIKVNFVFYPWARAYEEARHGNVNATSYWYKDPKHEKDFYLSEAVSRENVVFFRLKSDKPVTWKGLSDFDGLTIGITRSYTYTQELWRYAKQHSDSISIVNTDMQNFKMLLLERIDLTPIQETVGWHYLQSSFAKEQVNRVEVMRPPLSVRTGHLLFPKSDKNSKKLVQQFNIGLKQLIDSGRVDELKEALILGRYSN